MSTIPIYNAIRIIPRETDFLDRNVGSRGEIFFDRQANALRIYDGTAKGGTSVLTPTNVTKEITSSGVATVNYTTTVARNAGDTGNVYYLNGVENPPMTFVIGYTYVFDQTDLTNLYFPNSNGTTLNQHPINFSSDNANGELSTGTTYLNNVIYQLDGVIVTKTKYKENFATATTRSVQITVTNSTPTTLYTWCGYHANMGNTITVAQPGTGSGGASLEVSDTAPNNPSNGDIWYNSSTAKLYVYVQDTDSSQWVQPAAPAPGTLLGLGIADGTNGQVLTTDGNGTFTFQDAAGGGLSNVVDDTTPQLGGDLDAQTFDITTTGKVYFANVFATEGDLPSATTYHGMFAHVHATGAGYFAHAGAWVKLANNATTLAGYGITDGQATLVSGTNIKTVNGTSLIGSGDIAVAGNTGNITFNSNTIDSTDSTSIVFTPAVDMDSDVTVGNDLTILQDAIVGVNLTVNNNAVVNNDLTVQNNLIINGEFTSEGSGTPEIFSDNEIELNAGTRIVPTTGPLQMLRVTTTQRNALTAANGDLIYNTTDNKFQGYENGSWVNLI